MACLLRATRLCCQHTTGFALAISAAIRRTFWVLAQVLLYLLALEVNLARTGEGHGLKISALDAGVEPIAAVLVLHHRLSNPDQILFELLALRIHLFTFPLTFG